MKPTARVSVEIYPSGEPGLVKFMVVSDGLSEGLTAQEAIYVLETAAQYIRDNPDAYQPV